MLFRLRSQTLDVKMNYGSRNEDILCEVCKLFPEIQSHVLQCPEITPKLNLVNLANLDLDEKFIYSNIENQLKITKMYCQVLEIREKILEERKSE